MTDSLFRPTENGFKVNGTKGAFVPGVAHFELDEPAASFEPPGPIIPTRSTLIDSSLADSSDLVDTTPPLASGANDVIDGAFVSTTDTMADPVDPYDVDPVGASTDDDWQQPAVTPASRNGTHSGEPAAPAQAAPYGEPVDYVPPAPPHNAEHGAAGYPDQAAYYPPPNEHSQPIAPPQQRPSGYAPPQAPTSPSPSLPALQPHSAVPAVSNQNRVEYLPMPTSSDVVNAPVLVIEHRHIEPAPIQAAPPVPPAPSWSLGQLLAVLSVMAIIATIGSVIGWNYGGRAEPVYAARSEFIYFLEDAVPDGFLREDRRILTQLVTIESETILQPIAADFGTTVKELRDAINVEVVDLSEVIRLDVEDPDQERALAINSAILSGYTNEAESTFTRTNSTGLERTRDDLMAKLQIADEQSRSIQIAETEDVELRVIEESLTRELEIATQRFQNLRSIDDGLLVESTTVDDTASLTSQIGAAENTIARLEGELVSVRSDRQRLQQQIQSTPDEFAYQANDARQQDAALSVREESIQTQISTAAERVRRLEALRAESLVNNEVQPNAAPVGERLAATEATMAELETQLLNVRTKRTQVAQRAAALPSLTREVERLEGELRVIETRLGDLELNEQAPSPIEILTNPLVLDEPVGNPRMQMAALGFLASVPIAALAAAFVRSRQRRNRY